MNNRPTPIFDTTLLDENIKSAYDWRCVVLSLEADNPMQTFFLGKSRNFEFKRLVYPSFWCFFFWQAWDVTTFFGGNKPSLGGRKLPKISNWQEIL